MPTELHLPTSLPYPIKIVSVDADVNADVQRGSRLLSYSFVRAPSDPKRPPETRFGTWDCAVEGTVSAWWIRKGDTVTLKRAKEKPAVAVTEPCTHDMQVNGMCALCGKDMTNSDYIGFDDTQRAHIQMTHTANGPTVSLKEAQRLERETAEHLLKTRRLSLIVDLDQTIVHATVDPTVGEWITEGEAWEARQAKRNERQRRKVDKEQNGASDDEDSSDSSSDESQDNDVNPNWEALKDVRKFRLAPESFVPHHREHTKGKTKGRVEDEGCLYYIKPRPGCLEFLRHVATKYEMHVYTMGTRAYAEEVCKAIDPDRKIFGGRILSRDESGSLTQKSLARLFPCDTSMVVIIDDRADVWEWSPNLVKVIPYEFFVGIGDINSSFLPKLDPLAALPAPKPKSSGQSPSPSSGSTTAASSTSSSPTLSAPTKILLEEAASPGADLAKQQAAQDALLEENALILEAQLEERPLAKMQEELSERGSVNGDTDGTGGEGAGSTDQPNSNTPEGAAKVEIPKERHVRKALLTNDDVELIRVKRILDHVHQSFFTNYDSANQIKKSSSVTGQKPEPPIYDARQIIIQMRMETLRGVHIVFSSVIPLDMRPETSEIWKTAHAFGAECSTELTSKTTHVVANKRGTAKVDAARRRGGIKIVWLPWFTDSIALWQRQDERPYLLDEPVAVAPGQGSSSSPINESSQMGSSDLDLDTDWDEDDGDHDLVTPAGGNTPSGTGPNTPSKPEGLTNEVAWEDIDAEVEAAMNESDTEDGGSEKGDDVMKSANASEDEADDNITNLAPESSEARRKRLRSLTPSEVRGLNDADGDDALRSPLAKRKKLAADRSGASKLKEAVSAAEVHADDSLPTLIPVSKKAAPSPRGSASGSTGARSTDSDDNDEDDGDDFLADEFGEEGWS